MERKPDLRRTLPGGIMRLAGGGRAESTSPRAGLSVETDCQSNAVRDRASHVSVISHVTATRTHGRSVKPVTDVSIIVSRFRNQVDGAGHDEKHRTSPLGHRSASAFSGWLNASTACQCPLRRGDIKMTEQAESPISREAKRACAADGHIAATIP